MIDPMRLKLCLDEECHWRGPAKWPFFVNEFWPLVCLWMVSTAQFTWYSPTPKPFTRCIKLAAPKFLNILKTRMICRFFIPLLYHLKSVVNSLFKRNVRPISIHKIHKKQMSDWIGPSFPTKQNITAKPHISFYFMSSYILLLENIWIIYCLYNTLVTTSWKG